MFPGFFYILLVISQHLNFTSFPSAGHSRQGIKCRMCKTNVHVECQDQVAKCQPKSRLLRRQRSTSEIESKQMEGGDDDSK